MRLPRFQRSVAAAPAGAAVNPAAGAPGQELERVLSTFSQEVFKRRAAEQQAEGALEGLESGLEGEELEQRGTFTIRDRAFNQAARTGHVAGIRNDIKTTLADLALKARDLPADEWVDAFTKTSDGVRDGLLEESSPAIRGEVLAYFNDTASNLRLKMLESQQGELRKQTINDLKVGGLQLLDDITTAAREGDVGLLTARQKEFEQTFDTAVEAGLMDPALADQAVKDMHSQAILGEMEGAFEVVLREDGLEAGEKSLARLEKAAASGMDLSAEEKDQLALTLRGRLNRARSDAAQIAARERAATAAASAGLNRRATDTISMLEAGFQAPVDQLAEDLVRAEKFDKLAELGSAVELQGKLGLFQSAPLSEQDAALETLRADLNAKKLDPEAFRFFRAAERVRNNTETLLEKDPRTLAIRQGIIERDPALVLDSVETFAESLTARVDGSNTASQHYGRQIPALTELETDQLGAFWDQAGIDERLAISQAMVDGLGPEAGEVLGLLDQKGFRLAAFTGGLVSEGQHAVATSVLRGEQAIAANSELMPSGANKALLDEHISGTLGSSFAHLPEFRQTTTRAINAWYADRASTAGDFSGEFDADRANLAIEAVAGNVLEDNTGGQFVLRDVRQSQFESWFNSIDKDDIIDAGGVAGHESENAADLVRRASVVAMGPGVLRFTIPNPFTNTPQFLITAEGAPFELTVDLTDIPPSAEALENFPAVRAL